MNRVFWKQLALDSHILLASGGAALAGYLEFIVHGKNGFQVIPGCFLFFLGTYAIHALVGLRSGRPSLNELKSFWSHAHLKIWLSLLGVMWAVYLYVFTLKGVVLLGLCLISSGYSFMRYSDQQTHKLTVLKVPFSVMSIWCILVFSVGLEVLEYKVPLSLLALHLCVNVMAGDLRDIKVDREHERADRDLDAFDQLKKRALCLSLGAFAVSFFFYEIAWSLVFLFNAVLLWRMKETTKSDVYHLFDLVHFIPLGGCFLFI